MAEQVEQAKQVQQVEQPLLRLRNVSRTFSMGEVEVTALRNVDLDIAGGELCVVVGPSGSGKSTLLNLVGGIDTPTTGEVWFEDRDLAKLSESQLTDYRRKNVGFVFQFYNLVPSLTALENVRAVTAISENPLDPTEAMRLVGLEDRLHHFPSQLSGGEQQRVSIARAIARRPKLLLCDEPTGALDYATGKPVLGLLQRLNQQERLTVVIITHNAPIAAMADRVVRMGSGAIVECQSNRQPLSVEEISW